MSSKFKVQKICKGKNIVFNERDGFTAEEVLSSNEEPWDPVTKLNAQIMREVLQQKWKNLNPAQTKQKTD